MTIFKEFLKDIDLISWRIKIPCINRFYISNDTFDNLPKNKFGAIFLKDGSVGVSFLRLLRESFS